MGRARRPAFTLVEAMVGFAIIALISMAVVTCFRVAIMAQSRSTSATYFLTAVRKSFQGSGTARGMLFDSIYASSPTSASTSALQLATPAGAVNYSLSSGNLLCYAGSTSTLATGLSGLTLTYYMFSSTSGIAATDSIADARLVTISFKTTWGGSSSIFNTTTTWFSGGAMKNHL